MSKAIIEPSGQDGWFNLIVEYDTEFIGRLKKLVPYSFRKWDRLRSLWIIRSAYLSDVKKLLVDYFEEVLVKEEEAEKKTKSRPRRELPKSIPQAPVNAFAPLFELAKEKGVDITKLYKALANTVHPDHGGDTGLMKQLNAVYDKAKKK